MSTLIIEYAFGPESDGSSTTPVQLLLDDELTAAVSQTDQPTLAGTFQTLDLIELIRYCGQPGDLVAVDVPPDHLSRFARRLDALVSAGQLQ